SPRSNGPFKKRRPTRRAWSSKEPSHDRPRVLSRAPAALAAAVDAGPVALRALRLAAGRRTSPPGGAADRKACVRLSGLRAALSREARRPVQARSPGRLRAPRVRRDRPLDAHRTRLLLPQQRRRKDDRALSESRGAHARRGG